MVRDMYTGIYYAGCLIAIAVLESFPRFLFEASQQFQVLNRALLIVLFLAGAYFFKHTLRERWKWSVLSSMFFVDALAAVAFAILLFLQLFSVWFAFIAGIIILTRAGIFAYLISDRMQHLRGLVFFTTFLFLVTGELVLTFGLTLS